MALKVQILMSPSLSSSFKQMRIQNIHFTKSSGSCFNLSLFYTYSASPLCQVEAQSLNLSANPEDVCVYSRGPTSKTVNYQAPTFDNYCEKSKNPASEA